MNGIPVSIMEEYFDRSHVQPPLIFSILLKVMGQCSHQDFAIGEYTEVTK